MFLKPSRVKTSSGAGVENVDATIQLLTDARPARVLMAQPLKARDKEGAKHLWMTWEWQSCAKK